MSVNLTKADSVYNRLAVARRIYAQAPRTGAMYAQGGYCAAGAVGYAYGGEFRGPQCSGRLTPGVAHQMPEIQLLAEVIAHRSTPSGVPWAHIVLARPAWSRAWVLVTTFNDTQRRTPQGVPDPSEMLAVFGEAMTLAKRRGMTGPAPEHEDVSRARLRSDGGGLEVFVEDLAEIYGTSPTKPQSLAEKVAEAMGKLTYPSSDVVYASSTAPAILVPVPEPEPLPLTWAAAGQEAIPGLVVVG